MDRINKNNEIKMKFISRNENNIFRYYKKPEFEECTRESH